MTTAIDGPPGIRMRVQRLCSPRVGFTAIELAAVISIVLILVSTSAAATLPMLRRAAINQSLSRLEEVNAQASLLARRSSDTTAFYGVVIRRDGSQLRAAVTFGTSATWANRAIGATGEPLRVADLGSLAQLYVGSTHASATPIAAGTEVGWMYRSRTGRMASGLAPTLAPCFIGVQSSTFAGAGILDATVLVDQAVSLRSSDQRHNHAIAVYASGVMSTCSMNGP
jgi:type II secretory pathway pseudopilin PulG